MRRILQITVLIVAGEMIFSLPFHTARFFRPTFLDVFGFSNTDLGDIFAVYGIAAMLSYFPGGVVADHYSARTLLCVSLLLTSLGGIYMATIPGPAQMALLYGYWGVTTIFLFWAAMIRAVREWGGEFSQGRAFGILDGGRGFVAAAVAGLAVALLASYLPDVVEQASDTERRHGFSAVILLYSAVTAIVGLLTWSLLPGATVSVAGKKAYGSLTGAISVLRRPVVWAQAGIIVCAYCGFKGGDNFSLYAVQVLGMNEVDGASLSAYTNYIRPIAAVSAGILADRYVASRVLGVMFAVLVVSYFLFFSGYACYGLVEHYLPEYPRQFFRSLRASWRVFCARSGNANAAQPHRDNCRRCFVYWFYAGDFFRANNRSNSRCVSRRSGTSILFPVPGGGVLRGTDDGRHPGSRKPAHLTC